MIHRPNSRQRGYTREWERARERHLAKEPTCRMCNRLGRVSAATVVDHIVPHRGDMELFWDTENWQSLCGTCHDTAKKSEDATGVRPGCDVSGLPLDAGHHWNGGGGSKSRGPAAPGTTEGSHVGTVAGFDPPGASA